MIQRFPPLIAALCLTLYWFWVIVKLIRLARKIGKDPNAIPREKVGRRMRYLWYPCIFMLLVSLWWSALTRPLGGWLWRAGDLGVWGWVLEIAATLLCVACTAITFVCWRKMGTSWRIGIDPGETLVLVSTGPYRFVRHPIYALRMVINVCAFIMVPSLWVLIPAAVDLILLQIEARREESYMEQTHGAEYVRYKNSVGRFVPRAFVV